MSEAVLRARLNAGRLSRSLAQFAMPLLGVGTQYLAERTAQALAGVPLGLGWLASAARTPWTQAWIGLELATLAVWVAVLSRLKISEAFPMTAFGYVLVVGMGWVVFHEPVTAAQIVGGAAILGGLWLLGGAEEAA